ncbi:MAG TPA: histidinol dehydrogenase, partial [Myxococcaceae bacterium]|nr:histidinol dehydrogenase [Myxococcaceae bacterium]
EKERNLLLDRTTEGDFDLRQRVSAILARVRVGKDAALIELALELDRVRLTALEVPREEWKKALSSTPPAVLQGLRRAHDNIARAHQAFRPRECEVETEPGVRVGRRPDPLGRVGVYAPGGRAAYPSSVLMGTVPARVAGVREIIVCSPPSDSGFPLPVVLAAAELAQVDRVFAIGGAGAIGAMAYGTQTVPRVDRIVGPGNAYVVEAKLQVSNRVGIDAPAGPSEILAIADERADLEAIARELLAQAEHDPQATVIALSIGEAVAKGILGALERRLPRTRRADIIREALRTRSAVLWVDSTDEAVRFSNEFAPEHLLLAVSEPEQVLSQVRNAGTVFLGETSSVAFGDYLTGSNHVLPTGGLARSYSGLSTLDFMRWTSYQQVTLEAADRLSRDVEALAEAEGLFAHGDAARAWRKRK